MADNKKSSFFATSSNVCINTTLNPSYFSGILNWAIAMDKVDEDAPKLPPAPDPPELDKYETALAVIVRNWAQAGARAARRIGHDPLAPHMPKTARPGASTFGVTNLDPLYWSAEDAIVIRCSGGPGVRIITLSPAKGTCGTERKAALIDEETYTMKLVHGWLMPVGKVEMTETPTDRMTLVFTHEGPAVGWVLASGYPGLDDPKANRDGLSEGDQRTGAELKTLGFVRGVSEE